MLLQGSNSTHENMLLQGYVGCNKIKQSIHFIAAFILILLHMKVETAENMYSEYFRERVYNMCRWVDEMRYLGIFIVRSGTFKCSLEHAKKSSYRAANAVFAKIGRVASEEVTLQLIKVKCSPVLLYGLEACPLTKSDLQSLDFVINRFFMKLFTTKNTD